MPSSKPSTPLRVIDVMALVAVTALCLGLIRAAMPRELLFPYMPSGPDGGFIDWSEVPALSKPWLDWAVVTLQFRFLYFSPLVATWTVAVLALSLRGPRRSRARLVCRPGTAAGIAATASFAFAAVRLLVVAKAKNAMDQPGPMLLLATGMAVAGAWSVLIVGGLWRPERGTLDRAGRFLGLVWIAMGPFLNMLRFIPFW